MSTLHAFAQPTIKQLDEEARNRGMLSLPNPVKTFSPPAVSLLPGQEIDSDKEANTCNAVQGQADRELFCVRVCACARHKLLQFHHQPQELNGHLSFHSPPAAPPGSRMPRNLQPVAGRFHGKHFGALGDESFI